MKFKSIMVSSASGSAGGTTWSHNAYGKYIRERSIPTNPQSAAQTSVRNAMATITSAWSNALTAAQRAAWSVYGQNVAMTDALGDTIYLSGLAHYVRSNVPRLRAGLARVDDGPTNFTLPETDTAYAITCSEAAQTVAVTFDDTATWCDTDGAAMIVQQSPPQNVSINFHGSPIRFCDSIDGDSGTPPTSPAALATVWAFIEGQRIFTRARISLADGRLSYPFLGSVDCTA